MLQTGARLHPSDILSFGQCLLWRPELVWLHVFSDFVIALSYFSIAAGLMYFVTTRKQFAFSRIVLLFAAFLLAGGAASLAEIWTVWDAQFAVLGSVKGITAVISIITTFFLWPSLRRAVDLPAPGEMQREIEQRRQAQLDLQNAPQSLERRITERTRELEKSNRILLQKTKMLERFTRVTQDRELEMRRLKNEIDALLDSLNRPRRYHSAGQSLSKLKIGGTA